MWNYRLKLVLTASIILCHAACLSRVFHNGSAPALNQRSAETKRIEKSEAIKELAGNLERLGFFKHTDPALLEKAKAEVYETDSLFEGSTERDYVIHPEDLAKGGVKGFLEEASFFLEREGVATDGVEESFEVGGEYSVAVNGRRYVMYSQAELELKAEEVRKLTTRRAFALVNTLLQQAGSNEKVYLLNDDNEAWAVFLTPEMYEIISQSYFLKDEEKPKFLGQIRDLELSGSCGSFDC